MPEKKRFLKSVSVNFISLVDRGANLKTIIYKAASRDFSKKKNLDSSLNLSQPENVLADRKEIYKGESYLKTIPISKCDEDQRMVYGIVYSPGEVDSDGDFTSADVIRQMAYDFMKNRNTNNVDHQHDYNPDEGFVAESWLIEKNDTRFPGEPEGSWAVGIRVTNEDTWLRIKKGEITGLSMAGVAEIENAEHEEFNPGGLRDSKLNKIIKSVTEAIRKKYMYLTKDFTTRWNSDQIQRMTWALQDSVSEVLNDESVTDKKAAILDNIDPFRAAVEAMVFDGEDHSDADDEEIENEAEDSVEAGDEKPGEKDAADGEGKKGKGKKRPVDELKKSVDELKDILEQKYGDIDKRLGVVEKSSPGSLQAAVEEDVLKRDRNYSGPAWLG